jgi:hypothetical protein
MMGLLSALEKRFGQNSISLLPKSDSDTVQLALITFSSTRNIRILTTIGLSDYLMPVDDKFKGHEHNEIYFCLPSYWDCNDFLNPNFNWVQNWLEQIVAFVYKEQTWLAHGQTLSSGNPPIQLSKTMKQTYFLFSHPIVLKNELQAIQLDSKNIHFLAVIPLYKDEFEYKVARGMNKFLKKFNGRNASEILDDYRESTIRKKYILF